MKKRFLLLFLIFVIIAMAFMSSFILPTQIKKCSARKEYFQTVSKGAVVIEATSKRVLYEKNKDTQLPMASTTKIMTALVALNNVKNLDEVFSTDDRAVGIEGTSIYLKKGEHLSMRHLLYGLMLNSGNDAALAIAYKVGSGNLDTFVDMMNQTALNLGLHNTHFENPHGLDSKCHFTSAYDLAVITAEAMKNKDFRDIVKTKHAQIPGDEEGKIRFLRNKHKLLQEDYRGCEGIKTGFTDNARRCCVTSVLRQNMRLICVVLNCQPMFEESKALLENCFSCYKRQNLLEPNKYVDSVSVEEGHDRKVKTYTKEAFYYPLRDDEISKINMKVILPETIKAPVKKDTPIGELKIYLSNNLIFTTKIYTIDDVETKDYNQKIKDIIENWY